MELELLRIEPTSELSLKLGGNRIGKLSALCIDLNHSSLLGVPKIKLEIMIEAKTFSSSTALNVLVNKVSKFKFIDVIVMK